MGPLVPDVFSLDASLVLAILSGFGFGFFLEQAGFSSTKKLVGLFYGYDFTVLRVFFTAGVTAMIGILLLNNFGLVDLSLLYVNPTFLWSALVGGVIMGLGFILGGYCPGTSICAASIGRLDAMIFVGGAFIGILLFMEGYPMLESLYLAANMGSPTFSDILGISPLLFGFLLLLVALGAFYGVTIIEKKINNKPIEFSEQTKKRTVAIASIPVVLFLLIIIKPSAAEQIQAKINSKEYQDQHSQKQMNIDKFAFELINNHHKINLIDLRDKEAFKKYHLPLAVNIPYDEVQQRAWSHYFSKKNKMNVFYSDKPEQALKASLLADFIGVTESYYIKETPEQFKKMFYELEKPAPDASKTVSQKYFFRKQSAEQLAFLEEALKRFSNPVKKKVVKIPGGC